MQQVDEASDAIFTIPNVISFARMCLIPVFLVLLTDGHNALAACTFAIAAATDFIDGQLARRLNCVSKLGQLLDPAVDRLLMISGVVGLMMTHRLPAWIVFLVVARDLFLIVGGFHLLSRWKIRVPVIFPGKVATTLLFFGFVGLLLNAPLIPGLGVTSIVWLPGFSAEPCSWGIWFVYAGLVLTVFTTSYYVAKGRYLQKQAEARENAERQAAEAVAYEDSVCVGEED